MFEIMSIEEFWFINSLFGIIGITVAIHLVLAMITPAWTFFNRSTKLWIPGEDRRGSFENVRVVSGMATTKDGRTYIANKDHFWKDKKSGCMIGIAYGGFGRTVDSRLGVAVQRCKELGIKTYSQLLQYYMNLQKQDEKGKMRSDTELKKDGIIDDQGNVILFHKDMQIDVSPSPKFREKIFGQKPENIALSQLVEMLKVDGQTIKMSDLVEYYSENTRADLTEARIQHRVAVEEKLEGKKDIFKYIIALAIIVMIGSLAFVMVWGALGGTGGGSVNPEAIAKAVAMGLQQSQQKIVTDGQSVASGIAETLKNTTVPTQVEASVSIQ